MEFLTRDQAARHLTNRGLAVSKLTLQKWATVGGGPLYRKFGNRTVYTTSDLDAWAMARLRPPRRSTSEAAHNNDHAA